MNRWCKLWVFVAALCLGALLLLRFGSRDAYAYTREEIEAAKAWLSANGYSPDAGGAAQAYSDYQNGKFGGTPAQEPQPGAEADGSGTDTGEQQNEVIREGGEEAGNGNEAESGNGNEAERGEGTGAGAGNGSGDGSEAAGQDPAKDAEQAPGEKSASTDGQGGTGQEEFLGGMSSEDVEAFIAAMDGADLDEPEREVDESLKVTVERTDNIADGDSSRSEHLKGTNSYGDGIVYIAAGLVLILIVAVGARVMLRKRK